MRIHCTYCNHSLLFTIRSPAKDRRSHSIPSRSPKPSIKFEERKGSLGNHSPILGADLTRRKSFASENIINGYAHYLTDTKFDRRKVSNVTSLERVAEQQQWNMTTWV